MLTNGFFSRHELSDTARSDSRVRLRLRPSLNTIISTNQVPDALKLLQL